MEDNVLKLYGTLSGIGLLYGTLQTGGTLMGSLALPEGALDVYDGAYTVTPILYDSQMLETANKRMSHNIEVYKIPIAQTTNLAGGYTVVVG